MIQRLGRLCRQGGSPPRDPPAACGGMPAMPCPEAGIPHVAPLQSVSKQRIRPPPSARRYVLPTRRAPVAQLDRAPDYESGGQRFESFRARHSFQSLSDRSAYTADAFARLAVHMLSTLGAGKSRWGALSSHRETKSRSDDLGDSSAAPSDSHPGATTISGRNPRGWRCRTIDGHLDQPAAAANRRHPVGAIQIGRLPA